MPEHAQPSDVFISYSRADDAAGFVASLHDELEADFRTLTGRDLLIFFDRHDIRLLDDWRDKILAGLQSSRLFLACISPDYFRSDPCRWEWAEWIKHELARGQSGAGIACIYFVEIKSLTQPERAEAALWMQDLQRRHGLIFAPWYPLGPEALLAADARARLREATEHLKLGLDRLDLARDVPGNLDALNPGFVGRLPELAKLHKAVRLAPIGITTAVQGLGGMGKTALALHYAHGYGREYPGGRWQLRCGHQYDLNTVITQINESLQLQYNDAESKDTRAKVEKILAHCLSRGRTLLLLDNVDNPTLLSATQTAPILGKPNLHILFTTRLPKNDFPGLPRGSEFLALDQLDPADALELIRQHQPGGAFPNELEEKAAAAIIQALAGITLAIETAAIYLGRHASQVLPSAYLTRLRADLLEYHERVARSLAGAIRHGVPEITATLRPTLDSLPPAERTILALAALSAPDVVILPWLRAVASAHHPELMQAPQLGELDPWTEHITHLTGLRLLRPTEEPQVLAIHRVLQEITRACHPSPLDKLEKQLHDHAWSRATFLVEGWVQRGNRWELLPLAATAEHWMQCPDGIGRGLADQLSEPLQQLQHLGKAESLLLSAIGTLTLRTPKGGLTLQLLIQHLPDIPRHPHMSLLLNNLAALLLAMNRLAEAEPLMRRALVIAEASLGIKHPNVAIRLNNLAQLLQATNRYGEAEPLLLRALSINEASFGPEHLNVAIDFNNLALLLHATNRLTEAESMYRRALAISEAKLGPEHPHVAKQLNNIATLLQDTNRLGEAEPLMRRVLAILESCFGPEHPNVATAINNLTQLLQATNRRWEAEPLMRRALAIDEASLGPEHPGVATDLSSLAALLQDTNRMEEAEPLYRRALAIDEASFGPEHPDVARDLNNLAQLLQDTSRLVEAEPLMRRALAIDEASFGPEHPNVAIRLNNLAALLQATNRLAEPEPLMRRMVLIFLQFTCATGHPHPNLHGAMRNFAGLCQAMQMLPEEIWAWIFGMFREAGLDEAKTKEILRQAFPQP